MVAGWRCLHDLHGEAICVEDSATVAGGGDPRAPMRGDPWLAGFRSCWRGDGEGGGRARAEMAETAAARVCRGGAGESGEAGRGESRKLGRFGTMRRRRASAAEMPWARGDGGGAR